MDKIKNISLVLLVLLSFVPVLSMGQNNFDSAVLNQTKAELKLLRITPKGDAVSASQRQIVFKFNQPVVALGDMQRSQTQVPITIRPKLQCEWLWIDTSTLSCQIKATSPLRPATRYQIELKPELAAVSGAKLVKGISHSFSTERPKLRRAYLENWTNLSKPVAGLRFNQPITRKSLAGKIWYQVNGKKVAVKIEQQYNPYTDLIYGREKVGDEVIELPRLLNRKWSKLSAAEQQSELLRRENIVDEARQYWVVTPAQDLDENSWVSLELASGLKSIYGDLVSLVQTKAHRFKTLPKFEFLGMYCGQLDKPRTLIKPQFAASVKLREDDQEKPNYDVAECLPSGPNYLAFSSPVSYKMANQNLLLTPLLSNQTKGSKLWPDYENDYQTENFFRSRFSYQDTKPYYLTIPGWFKPFTQYGVKSVAQLKDIQGRDLSKPIDMAFLTSHSQPRFGFSRQHSVLEKDVDSEVPLEITNIDSLKIVDYSITTAEQLTQNQQYQYQLPEDRDATIRIPSDVKTILNSQSGMLVGKMVVEPKVGQRDYSFSVQVTPFHVHFKLGHFSSLVWITDLKTGLPVNNASVKLEIDQFDSIDPIGSESTIVKTDKNGVASLPGIVEFDPELKDFYNYKFNQPRIMLKVAKGDDIAVLPLDWSFMVRNRVGHYMQSKESYLQAWGTTAQGVYRAGDKIDYKIYVRNQNSTNLVAPPNDYYQLEIVDPKGKVVESKPVTLSEFGTFSDSFKSNQNTAVGWYNFKLSYSDQSFTQAAKNNKDIDKHELYPMQVLISDFTPASFKVRTELNGKHFNYGDTAKVNTSAKMYSGGAYANANARITATLESMAFQSKHPVAKGFNFDSRHYSPKTIHQNNQSVNQQGELITDIPLPIDDVNYGRLRFESAVRDDRGKNIASAATAEYFGRDRFIGLRNTAWTHKSGKQADVEMVVTDTHGVPLKDIPIKVDIEHYQTRAARVKGSGNAYLTEYTYDWVKVADCVITSKVQAVTCSFIPEKPGQYRFSAKIKDSQNRDNQASIYTWVVGKGAVVWQQSPGHSLDMVPDAESYQAGQKAKILIKNPFPDAQALITVERYGIIRHYQQTLNGSTPIITVPIKKEDYPGVYVSVVVTSPRVQKPLGKDNVDLGKPEFRLGYLKLPVSDDTKELAVTAKPDREVYKPREQVSLSLRAKPKRGNKEPIEMAVVVIDEAVFDLNKQGKNYYNPMLGFNNLDSLGVANYNLLKQLVGRQKFSKKGANPGGDGMELAKLASSMGEGRTRDFFKYVAYWNPSIKLDGHGKAKVDFELPDNLTGWRVFAFATTKREKMGLATAQFKTNQSTELRPVMPNQLTSGDQVNAGFSVMNRTNQKRTIAVTIEASGNSLKTIESRTVNLTLPAFQRESVWLPIQAHKAGNILLTATAGDNLDQDRLEYELTVNPKKSLLKVASYGTTAGDGVMEKVKFPKDMMPESGQLSVSLSPSVLANLSGAFEYLRDYPYGCWEQRLSKGLAAAQFNRLKPYLSEQTNWADSQTLANRTLQDASSFQAENGGMTYWINHNSHVSPYLSAYTALGFVWLREQGYQIPQQVENRLHEYLLEYLKRDTKNNNLNYQTARASIRAIAIAALAASHKLTEQQLLRFEPHFKSMDISGKAYFLQAAAALKFPDEKLISYTEQILANTNESAGKLELTEKEFLGSAMMLYSSTKSNCSLLSSFIEVAKQSSTVSDFLASVPLKQVRAITQSMNGKNAWRNTQENLICLNALVDYSQTYEAETPVMQLSAEYVADNGVKQVIGEHAFNNLSQSTVSLQNSDLAITGGETAQVKINKQGTGRFYYSVKAEFAKDLKHSKAINAGLEIHREYSVQREGKWQLITSPLQLAKGELVRVDLFVSAPTGRNYVVVNDPVAGGLEPVNRDLATSSAIDAQVSDGYDADSHYHLKPVWKKYGGFGYSFYHQELRHDSARFYADYLPAGDYHLSYTAQAIAAGSFVAMPVKAEEMYEPDIFGLSSAAQFLIKDQ